MKLPLPFFTTALVSLFLATSSHAQDSLRAFHPDTFDQIISQADAKPLVVLIWSLDCSYCLSSFQALAQAKAADDIEVATIATDSYDNAETRHLIKQKLEAGGLKGPAWAFGPWPSAKLRYAIDTKWRGELPRSYWYKNGHQVARHSGAITYDTVIRYLPK